MRQPCVCVSVLPPRRGTPGDTLYQDPDGRLPAPLLASWRTASDTELRDDPFKRPPPPELRHTTWCLGSWLSRIPLHSAARTKRKEMPRGEGGVI